MNLRHGIPIFLRSLLFLFCWFSGQALYAGDTKESPPSFLHINSQGVMWVFHEFDAALQKFNERKIPLLRIELSNTYFDDPALVSKELEALNLAHDMNKLLLVDFDETLISAEAPRCWHTPNLRIIKQMKRALATKKSYVAIVTYTQNKILRLRKFLRHYFPQHHHLIPIIYFDYDAMKKHQIAHRFYDSFADMYGKNIHAYFAYQIFHPFAAQRNLALALVDDQESLLDNFVNNVHNDIAHLGSHLPLIENAAPIYPGQFEGDGSYWARSRIASSQIHAFFESK